MWLRRVSSVTQQRPLNSSVRPHKAFLCESAVCKRCGCAPYHRPSSVLTSAGLRHFRSARRQRSQLSRSRASTQPHVQARSLRSSQLVARRSLIARRPLPLSVVALLCSRYCSCRWRRRLCCLTIRSSGPLRRVTVLSCGVQQRPLNSSVRTSMQRKPPLNPIAFTMAALLTACAALFTAWWYGLEWNVVFKFAPQYIGMFVIAIGVHRLLRLSPSEVSEWRSWLGCGVAQ